MQNKTILRNLLKEAQFFQERGRYTEASQKYSAILQHNSNHASALYGLAMCLTHQYEFEDAEKLIRKGMLTHPKSDLFYDAAFVQSIRFKDYFEASKTLELWLKNNSASGIAHSRNAELLMKTGSKNHTEILNSAKEGLRLNPMNSYSNETMAFALWKCKKDKAMALEYFTQALKLAPHDASLHNNFGTFLLSSGDPKRALDEFKMALRLDPNMQISVDNLGKALYATYPLFGWGYSFSVFMSKHSKFAKISPVIVFFMLQIAIQLQRLGEISELFWFSFILYLIYLFYSFWGYRLFMFLFRKGWIV